MSKDRWDEWIALVEKGPDIIRQTLEAVSKQQKLLVALCLACAKWHPRRQPYQGMLGLAVPDYETCALCHLYYERIDGSIKTTIGCDPNCPLSKIREKCINLSSVYSRWHHKRFHPTKSISAANRVYNVLYKLYREEYNRLLWKDTP